MPSGCTNEHARSWTAQLGPAPARRDHRRRLRRPRRGTRAARRAGRRHAARRQQLPHVPTTAVPGRHGGAGRRERGLRHPRQRPWSPPALGQRPRPHGPRRDHRPPCPLRRAARRRRRRLRLARRRHRRRQPRLRHPWRRRAHLAAQAPRGRARVAGPRPDALRGGCRRRLDRDGGRPRRRRLRRRTDRGGDGRRAARAVHEGAGQGLPAATRRRGARSRSSRWPTAC